MRFAIIYGKDDPAGNNIIQQLKSISFAPQIPIIKTKKHPIYLEQSDINKLPELKNIDFIIFASTHKSEKNELSLSIHAPGNFRGADFGGKPGKISNTSAFILKYLFQQLNKNSKQIKEQYNITLECTHHGPSIDLPCAFIEIGSTEKQYQDKEAGTIIARTILSLQDYKPNENWIPTIGIGGPHYCPNFNKIQLNSKYAISHIIPQYSLPLTQSMLEQTEQKTKEQIKEIIIDWKGCGNSEQRNKIGELLTQLNLKYKRTKEVKK